MRVLREDGWRPIHSAEVLDRYASFRSPSEHADGFSYAAAARVDTDGNGIPDRNVVAGCRTLSADRRIRLGMVAICYLSGSVCSPSRRADESSRCTRVEWLREISSTTSTGRTSFSHDVTFSTRRHERIIEIENGTCGDVQRKLTYFLVERELRREQQQREYENQQSMINKAQEFIRTNLAGQKTKQAKSRRNMLERLDRLDAVTSEKHGGNFGLKKVTRTGNNVLTVDDLAIGYSTKRLASHLNFSLMRGEVLGIIGGNGTGKTTLLKTYFGELPRLSTEDPLGNEDRHRILHAESRRSRTRNEVIQELRRVAPSADNGELRTFPFAFPVLSARTCSKTSAIFPG
jgi:ATP-binding cassette subfamily F protein 3